MSLKYGALEETLRIGVWAGDAYGGRVGVWDERTDVVEYGVENPTFLVDDPSDVAVVIDPRCRRLAREALCASEGRILSEESRVSNRGRGPINKNY
jgi:hypothetical protein